MRESEKVNPTCFDSPRFLLTRFLKKSTNGVIWYILGVVFVLAFFPLDIAVVSILM